MRVLEAGIRWWRQGEFPSVLRKANFQLYSRNRRPGVVFSWQVSDVELVIPDADYVCPSCGKYSMKFTRVGFFD
ncbi:MAG: hypothetical protein ACTSU5_08790 [Promethearchaeota archaeon]